jgi:hypothetical protein
VPPQGRAPDYRVVAAWSAFLVLIGAGAFALGMAFHNGPQANHRVAQARENFDLLLRDGPRDSAV